MERDADERPVMNDEERLGLRALARPGIQFNEAQEDVIKSLVAKGQNAEAQRIILAELEKQFGDVYERPERR